MPRRKRFDEQVIANNMNTKIRFFELPKTYCYYCGAEIAEAGAGGEQRFVCPRPKHCFSNYRKAMKHWQTYDPMTGKERIV